MDRLAKELDYSQQRMRIAYNRAWTAHWWHEDYREFNHYYDEVEQHLIGATQALDVERLFNLWQLLPPSVASGRISAQDAKVAPRQQRLAAMLQAIADDPARPNNALQARTNLTLMKITLALYPKMTGQLDAIWAELSHIVDASAALGAYPVQKLADIVREFGKHFDSPAFDALYEQVVDAMCQRHGEGQAGEAYCERGAQKLQQGKPYEAIRWFGRAEELLVKDEYRAELVMALAGSSYAYERVGLLWAARNKVLAAAERSLAVLMDEGEIIPPALLAMQRLTWIEFQLGRIPHVLTAMTMASGAASHLKLSEERQDSYDDEVLMQQGVLGIHLLNIPFEVLPAVSRLPDALERLGLTNARAALLFALGQTKAIYGEQYFTADESQEDLQTFFERWQDQPAADDLPPHPDLGHQSTTILRSTILGSELVVETPNDPTSLGIAESLLGALEAFLATSDEGDLLPHRERTTIVVTASTDLKGGPTIQFPEENSALVEIVHPAEMTFPTAEDARKFRDWLRDSVVNLLIRAFMIRDLETWLDKIAGQERAFSRALMFGDALTLDRNLFGDKPQLRLEDWLKPEDKVYERLRTSSWRAVKASEATEPIEPLKPGSGPPPGDLFDKSRLKHTERRVMSPIDIPLWNRAKWRATMYAWTEGAPPILGIAFENGKAGKDIFRAWRERWGDADPDDALRVAIITGLSVRNPAEYAVSIGPNFDQLRGSSDKLVSTVYRINRMQPVSSDNLDGFLTSYKRFGRYFMAPGQMGEPPDLFLQFFLAKHKLHIRQAWQIGENDEDLSALGEDDDPIIPPTVQEPPVNKALARIRARGKRSRPGL